MRALIIQHDHVSPPGPVGERLEQRGYELALHLVVEEDNFFCPQVHNPFPALDGVDLVVPMGAPWSVYDQSTVGAWVGAELDLLRAADAQGIPVLGICFGGQLLAAAHGGHVERCAVPEIGWVRIESDEPDLVPEGPWFAWHYDRWVPPLHAREIARNEVSAQAFTLRRNLAVQFHPELTSTMLAGWFSNGGDTVAAEAGHDVEELHAQAVTEDAAARRRAHVLVDAFLDRVADA